MERYIVSMAWKNSIVKMYILPKAIYTLNAISVKIAHDIFSQNYYN